MVYEILKQQQNPKQNTVIIMTNLVPEEEMSHNKNNIKKIKEECEDATNSVLCRSGWFYGFRRLRVCVRARK